MALENRRSCFLGWVFFLGLMIGCERPFTRPVEDGFQVQTQEVDFGRVQEFFEATQKVRILSLTRGSQTLTLSTQSPFSVQETLELPGAATVEFNVTFLAGDGPSEGELVVRLDDMKQVVKLKGLGAKPKSCAPARECYSSTYDFPKDTCMETPLDDGAPCTPSNLCLENGQCQKGQCNGQVRSCDDDNKCTSDGCGEAIGCVNSPAECAPPTEACKVAFCDPKVGCGVTNAADGTPCGTLDCTQAQVCLFGACISVVPPDGTPCAPKTPCQGEGTCQSKKCVRPPPGKLTVAHFVPLPDVPSGKVTLLGHQGAVFVETCPPDLDAGEMCHFYSVTSDGFDRFLQPLDGMESPQLAYVANEGATFVTASGFESRSTLDGGVQWTVPYSSFTPPSNVSVAQAHTSPGRIARTITGDVVASLSWSETPNDAGNVDAGTPRETLVWILSDGGIRSEQELASTTPSLVGSDYLGRVFLYESATGLVQKATPNSLGILGIYPGEASLLVGREGIWAGGKSLIPSDGGPAWASVFSDADAGLVWPLSGPQLLSRTTGYAFFQACESPLTSCDAMNRKTLLRAFSYADGSTLWETEVLSSGSEGKIIESALLSMGLVAAVSESFSETGAIAELKAFLSGREVISCPFPEGVVPHAALFEGNMLHALVAEDGGWILQAYEMGQFGTDNVNWPQRNGVSGTRQAR